MKALRHTLLLASICFLASCSSSPEVAGGTDPLSGTWVGDFGPAFYDRNTISIELHWNGSELTGMIRPGVQGGRMYRDFVAFPIENSSFDPNTGAIKFEAIYQPKNRRYLIEGAIKKGTFSGTWTRPDDKREGDFKLTRKTTS